MEYAKVIDVKLQGTSKLNVVRLCFYAKLLENGLFDKFTTREIDVLANLYLFKGTTDKESLQAFLLDCQEKGLTTENKTKATFGNSIRNIFTQARELGIVKRKTVNNWKISTLFMPENEGNEYIVFKGLISNYANKQ